VKVRRENYPGPVQLTLAAASPHVTVHGRVEEGSEEGSLELAVAAEARPDVRVLRLRAFALQGAAASAEGELSLTIQAADSAPPPPKPSLRLEDLAAVRVQAGQTKIVPVKIKRERCPGPVSIKLTEALPGVEVRNGLVDADSEEGTVEVVV